MKGSVVKPVRVSEVVVPSSEDLNAWKTALGALSADLSPDSPSSRESARAGEVLRARVLAATTGTPVRVLRWLCRALGVDPVPVDRLGAACAAVNQWLALPPHRRASAHAPVDMRRDLAGDIATLAEALEEGRVTGPEYVSVLRLAEMVETLRCWTPDDRGV